MTHPNSTLGLYSSISHARRVTTIEEYVNDIVVSTRVVHSQAPDRTLDAPKRGKVSTFSHKSAARLRFAIRNLPDARQFATFTYPAGITVSEVRFKSDWRRLREWLVRRSCAGIYVRETDERGLPHLHLVLQLEINQEEATRAWARIVGSDCPSHSQFGVRVQSVTSPIGLANYLAKPSQKSLPTGWESMGRVWATFGQTKVEPIRRIQGDASDMMPLAEALFARTRRPPKSPGFLPNRFSVRAGLSEDLTTRLPNARQTMRGSDAVEASASRS